MKTLSPLTITLLLVTAIVGTACNKETPPSDNTPPVADTRETMTMTFADLLRLGKDYTCEFTYDDRNVRSSGTVYVMSDGDHMRGAFDTTDARGITTTANIIRQGRKSYLWGPSFDGGFVMTIPEDDASAFGVPETEQSADAMPGENDAVDLTCEAWDADPAMFEPPADVTFTDLSAQMQKMFDAVSSQMQQNGGTPQVDCSACDSVPAAARGQCRQALGCS